MRLLALTLAAVSVALALAAAPARAADAKPWLWQCEWIIREDAKARCFVRLLAEEVERSASPARALPEIDRRVREAGGYASAHCHVLMHEVGRRYAHDHGVTLASLRRYVPRSNDPGCSAGFGMGLVMYLGPQLAATGGRSALGECERLPTRFRSYTCVHGIGHALMRGYHGSLRSAVRACRRLGPDGADCAQGAFHDYWIALRGDDGTEKLVDVEVSPRVLCDGRLTYVRPCWYRYFLEQPGFAASTAADVLRACHGLAGLQRSGCIGGVAVTVSGEPFAQAKVCGRLRGRDAVSCVRGLAVQALAGQPRRQAALFAVCRGLEGADRRACASWLGRTLNVVTDGAFAARCRELPAADRAACAAGARRYREPLVTFA